MIIRFSHFLVTLAAVMVFFVSLEYGEVCRGEPPRQDPCLPYVPMAVMHFVLLPLFYYFGVVAPPRVFGGVMAFLVTGYIAYLFVAILAKDHPEVVPYVKGQAQWLLTRCTRCFRRRQGAENSQSKA